MLLSIYLPHLKEEKPKKEPSLPDACDTTIPAKKQPFGEKIYEGMRVPTFEFDLIT